MASRAPPRAGAVRALEVRGHLIILETGLCDGNAAVRMAQKETLRHRLSGGRGGAGMEPSRLDRLPRGLGEVRGQAPDPRHPPLQNPHLLMTPPASQVLGSFSTGLGGQRSEKGRLPHLGLSRSVPVASHTGRGGRHLQVSTFFIHGLQRVPCDPHGAPRPTRGDTPGSEHPTC